MVVLGLVCLCMFVAPAMAADVEVCSRCTPDTKPAVGTECPAACILVFDSDYWTLTDADAISDAEAGMPAASIFSGETLSVPEIDPMVSILSEHVVSAPSIDPMVSKLSGRNVESDVSQAYIY